jgi:hypothetical protein
MVTLFELISNIIPNNKPIPEIRIPRTIKTIHLKDKVRFHGKNEVMIRFVKQFYKLSELPDNSTYRLGDYTVKVSKYVTADRERESWIELPPAAWRMMASKFLEVSIGMENNPFDFSNCGFIDGMPLDIGIEITDLPVTDTTPLSE